ncbi:MAG: DUF2063 domain-containing protein [Psychromonas sp.]|nr:DUF2063 domain-containing protein [Alteromonadales bacterium]MCP5076899.1 DUF2063 domain-containing protein [Psychromonas sp.]
MKLRTSQLLFSESLRYQHDEFTQQIKDTQQISSQQRLQVYRNSFVMGVTEALAITYQHTMALVGEEFFNAVSREFIINQPPQENNIINYGLGFDRYLTGLPQLINMPYIAEMARFEWLLEATSNTKVESGQLDLLTLAALPEASFSDLRFTIAKQVNLFQSEQDIYQLYQMLMTESVVETDLNSPCYLALKKLKDFRVELIDLTPIQFSLLKQIKEGKTLAELVPTELHEQLPTLQEKGVLNGFAVTKEEL